MSFAGDKVANDRIHCPYHRVAGLVDDQYTGDLICPECGLVVGDRLIDASFEWYPFTGSKKQTIVCRVGDPQDWLLNSEKLSTIVEPCKVNEHSVKLLLGSVSLLPPAAQAPISLAAAVIFMASQGSEGRKTVKEIGDIAGVAEVTVSHSYRLMYPYATELFPEDMKDFERCLTLH